MFRGDAGLGLWDSIPNKGKFNETQMLNEMESGVKETFLRDNSYGELPRVTHGQ